MGATFSKLDADLIQAIESNVIDLLIKLKEAELYIDNFVKFYTLRGLDFYIGLIDSERQKGHISHHKAFKLKDLIHRAIDKLKEMQTCPSVTCNIQPEKGPEELKNEFLKVQKDMESHQIPSDKCEQSLNIVRTYVQNLENSESVSTHEEQNCISVLVLRLYLKSPPTKISDILQENLDVLGRVIETFGLLNWDNVSISETENVNLKVQEFKSKLDTLNKLANQKLRINTSESDSSFKKLTDDINEYEFLINKLGSPCGENALNCIQNKLKFLIDCQLSALPTMKKETETKKKFLLNKRIRVLHKINRIKKRNEEVNESLRILEEIERKFLTSVNTNEDFISKKAIIEQFQQQVDDLKIRSNEFRIRKIEISNKLDGFLILEVTHVLRNIKQFIDTFKVYAQQFSFIKNVDVYEFRKNEIKSALKLLDDLPRSIEFIDLRVQSMQDEIQNNLDILERKAIDNQNFFTILDQLDHIKNHIEFINSIPNSLLWKLKEMNKIRKRLLIIDNFNNRITTKKVEIFLQLHEAEEKIYSSESCQNLQDIKVLLDGYEKKVQEFSGQIADEDYYKHKNELAAALNDIQKLSDAKTENQEVASVLKNTADLILNLLDKVSTENKDQDDCLRSLNNIEENIARATDLTPEQRKKTLEEYEEILQPIKCSSKELKTLNKLWNVERRIKIEKAKLELHDLDKQLEIVKEDLVQVHLPLKSSLFKECLGKLLLLKETAEDMPEGDSKLDSEKTLFVQKVLGTIQSLDKNFTEKLRAKRAEKMCEMKRFYDEVEYVSEDSNEVIQTILNRAKNCENHITYYLGDDSSSDYCALRQNLKGLLHELEGLDCDDEELLHQVKEGKNYINGLMRRLD